MEFNIKGLYTGVVYDAMRFDLNVKYNFVFRKEIKPTWPCSEVLFGPAFTCKGEKVLDSKHIDDDVRLKMFQSFYEGCIQVISSGGYRDVAQFGDISGKIARKFGALGAVIDAPVRDVSKLAEDKFHIFSDGAQPIDAYGKWQITEYEVPIQIPGIEGDVTIFPGDFIFADTDGVLVIRKDDVEQTIDNAQKRLTTENVIREEVLKTNDIVELNRKVGRW